MNRTVIALLIFSLTSTVMAAPWWLHQSKSAGAMKVGMNLALARLKGEQGESRAQLTSHLRSLIKEKKWQELRTFAFAWQERDGENPTPYEFLAKLYHFQKDTKQAVRAITSLADLSPNDAMLLHRTGLFLLHQGEVAKAEEYLRRAYEEREDFHNLARGLALSLAVQNKYKEAIELLAETLKQRLSARYVNIRQVIREEMNIYLWCWLALEPHKNTGIESFAAAQKIKVHQPKKLRFSMQWNTETSDVDLVIRTPQGKECSSFNRQCGNLRFYADVAQGLGPEVAVNKGVEDGTYHLGVRYFAPGPMATSRGTVWTLIVTDEGKLQFKISPFVLHPSTKREIVHVETIVLD